MLEIPPVKRFEREVTPIERLFSRSPSATVGLIARIRGQISEKMLLDAVVKVQQRHPILRTRIQEDGDRLWFTSDGVEAVPVKIIPRESSQQWIQIYQRECKIPFEFDVRPALRLILVQSPTQSELMILCHHIICDGLSLAYLVRDLMGYLGDPNPVMEALPTPIPICIDNMPMGTSLSPVIRFLIQRLNRKWAKQKIYFDQTDYLSLNRTYWLNFRHRMIPIEFSEDQTTALVVRCRQEQVTVNTALSAAFLGAQCKIQAPQPYHAHIGIAGNLRNRLRPPVKDVMGFYAGLVTLKWKYNRKKRFWANARRLHKQIISRLTNKNLFHELQVWSLLDPTILESLNFKKLGGLVPAFLPRQKKLSAFNQQKDVVFRLLKINKMESLGTILMGLVITNLTRMDFPRLYGALELDRLFMHPGSAFPLATVNLVLGAVTCSGKLSIVLEYAEEAVDTQTVVKIKDEAMRLLFSE